MTINRTRADTRIPSSKLGAWVPLPLAANWTDTQGGFAPVAFRLLAGRRLELRGDVSAGAGAGAMIATLPGYARPVYDREVVCSGYAGGTAGAFRLYIAPSGAMSLEAGVGVPANGDNFTLDGIELELG